MGATLSVFKLEKQARSFSLEMLPFSTGSPVVSIGQACSCCLGKALGNSRADRVLLALL